MYEKSCELEANQLTDYILDFVRIRGPSMAQDDWKSMVASMKPCEQLAIDKLVAAEVAGDVH